MATPNPLSRTFRDLPADTSQRPYTAAGIPLTVYGLDELAPADTDVAVLWLLHPRLATHACMAPLAAAVLTHWAETRRREAADETRQPAPGLGCIAVVFDQRNHGAREVWAAANESWRDGNETHAQDMFSAYHGTTLDVSQLITYLSSYLFPASQHTLVNHMVLGVSLGGHAAWQCVLHDARITTAVSVIGCPDYASLMAERARLSKRSSYVEGKPPGTAFFGSVDFPPGLVQAVKAADPAATLLDAVADRTSEEATVPSDAEQRRMAPLLRGKLGGKRIMNLSGSEDKLVPYRCSTNLLRWLGDAVGSDGWLTQSDVLFEDHCLEGVGHEMTLPMVEESVRFIGESLRETACSLREPARSPSKL